MTIKMMIHVKMIYSDNNDIADNIFFSNRIRKLLLPTSSEDFKILEEGPLRVSVEVDIIAVTYLRLLAFVSKGR